MAIFKRKSTEIDTKSVPCDSNFDVLRAIAEGSNQGATAHSTAFCTNPYIYKAVTVRATAVSTPDLILTDSEGNAQGDRNHPLYKLLTHPNARQGWHEMMYDIEVELALHGVAYIYIERSGNNVRHLHVIPAERVTPQQSTNWLTPVAYYDVNFGNETRRVLPSDMIAICPKYQQDGFSPISPVDSAMDAIENQRKAREWNSSMMDNGGRPLTAVMIPDKLTSATYHEFANRYRSTMQGAHNAGATAILDGGKTIQSIGMSALDLDFNAGMVSTAREIAIAMNVPPELLGDSNNKTYSNAQEANREFSTHTVVPELVRICATLTRRLAVPYGDVVITYDREMVEGLTEDKTALIGALTSCNFLTPNEKRALLSYEPVDDGDTVLTTAGLIPLSDVMLDTDESDQTDPFSDDL